MKEIKIIDNAEFGNAVRDEILAEALEEERKIREQNDLAIVRDYNKDFTHSFDFEHEPDTGKITIRLKDKNGDVLDSKEIDLETEWIIKYAQIDLVAKVITFWGDHDQYKFECDISDLLDGIDEKIEKLDDRIDDVGEALGDEEYRAMNAEQKLADDLQDFKDNEFAEAVDQILALSDGLTAETTARAEADEALDEKIDDTKADLEDKIDTDCKALDEKIDATEEALTETISNAVEELDEKIDAGWALFNNEFMPRLDTRLGRIDDRIDGIDKRLDDRDTELNNKISELEDEDSELSGKIDSLADDMEEADKKLADDIAAVDKKADNIDDKADALDEKIDEEIENVTAKFADYLPLAGGKLTGKLELGDKASIKGTEEGQVIIDTGDTGYGLKIMSNGEDKKAYVEIKANLEDEHYLVYSGVGDHPACTLKLPEITADGGIDTIALESDLEATKTELNKTWADVRNLEQDIDHVNERIDEEVEALKEGLPAAVESYLTETGTNGQVLTRIHEEGTHRYQGAPIIWDRKVEKLYINCTDIEEFMNVLSSVESYMEPDVDFGVGYNLCTAKNLTSPDGVDHDLMFIVQVQAYPAVPFAEKQLSIGLIRRATGGAMSFEIAGYIAVTEESFEADRQYAEELGCTGPGIWKLLIDFDSSGQPTFYIVEPDDFDMLDFTGYDIPLVMKHATVEATVNTHNDLLTSIISLNIPFKEAEAKDTIEWRDAVSVDDFDYLKNRVAELEEQLAEAQDIIEQLKPLLDALTIESDTVAEE